MGQVVPVESILDCWSVEFLKSRLQSRPKDQNRYSDDFEFGTIEESVCILGNLFSRNFGHWTEELLKVALCEDAGIDCRYVVPDAFPPFTRASLALLGIAESRILAVGAPALFRDVLFTTAISHENIHRYGAVLDRLRELVRIALAGTQTRFGPRLWLERGASLRSGGVVANKDEVYDCISAYGFDVVDMASLSLADQFAASREASVIAGPHGSQFVHAQFMPVASTVVECFSPMYVNPSILQICRVLHHKYHQIVSRCNEVSPYVLGRDCQVDCEHLRLVLDALPS